MPRYLRSASPLLALAIVIAACSSNTEPEPVAAPDTSLPTTTVRSAAPSSVADTTPTPTTTELPADGLEELPPVAPDLVELAATAAPETLRFETLGAMGGMRVGFPRSARLIHDGDFVGVDPTPSANKYVGAPAFLAHVTQTANGEPVRSVAQMLSLARGVETARVEPTGTAIELFGLQLVGHAFEQAGQGLGVTPLFASARENGSTFGAWWPFPFGELYLAETGAGVLVAGMQGSTADEIDEIRPIFADLVVNAHLLGDIDVTPSNLDSFRPSERTDRPVPAEPAGDAPVLDGVFLPLRAERYQVLNLGERYTIEVPPGWAVKINTAGLTTIAASHSFGPLNSSIYAIRDVVTGQFGTTAPTPLGDRVDLTDLGQLVDTPPAGLVISASAEIEVGGRAALRFDLGFDERTDCSDRHPCVFAIASASGIVRTLHIGFGIRIWSVPAGDNGSIMFVASATDTDELDEIEQLIESVEFG